MRPNSLEPDPVPQENVNVSNSNKASNRVEPTDSSAEAMDRLEWAVMFIARTRNLALDRLRLQASVQGAGSRTGSQAVGAVMNALGYAAPKRLAQPDRVHLPLLGHTASAGWFVVTDREPDGRWMISSQAGKRTVDKGELEGACWLLDWQKESAGQTASEDTPGISNFSRILKRSMRLYRSSLGEAVVASVFIGLLALMTSLFSMQVYDRVIPTRGQYTLAVLGIGVVLSILIELALKFVRARIMDHVTVGLDNRLSREIFQRLLQIRIDQLPASVGSLAGQMRGYEQVRNFYTAGTLFALVDVPMGMVFLVLIAWIASPWVAAVPLLLAGASLLIGLSARRRVNRIAESSAKYSNQKTGLLVEAVDGVETIKSGSGGWKFLSRWLSLNAHTITNDLEMRHSSESVAYFAAALQQLSYAGVVVVGSMVVMAGDMTMGALIAASILSGRVLSPILMVPGLFVQHAHAKAALQGLDKLYDLKTDNEGLERVLIPTDLRGHFNAEQVEFAYGPGPAALIINSLEIKPGERVGVIGPIGSGKSTLLRLLSGMYVPNKGRILIDGLDLSHVSREVINRHMGYLQQEHRLFQGTLRENLLIGLPDPGDDALIEVMKRTGMSRLVLAHPLGLDRPISEGGKGLSGGQRQLVAFTRLMLTNPNVLLLDEPTSNMDQMQETQCLDVLKKEAEHGKTMVIVTHKPALLPLVDRIIVVLGNQIVADGPRDQVMSGFQALHAAQPPQPPGPQFRGVKVTVTKPAAATDRRAA